MQLKKLMENMKYFHYILFLFLLISCEQAENKSGNVLKKEEKKIVPTPFAHVPDTANVSTNLSELPKSVKRSNRKKKIHYQEPEEDYELIAEPKPIHLYVDEPAVITSKYRTLGDSIEFIYANNDPGNPAIGGSSTSERTVLRVKNVNDSFLFNTSTLRETSLSNEFTGEIFGTYGTELLSGTIQGTRNKNNTWTLSVDVKMTINDLNIETKKVKTVKFTAVFNPL
jgi:hypothetical protein